MQAKNKTKRSRVKSKNKRRRVITTADKIHNDKSYTMKNVIRDNPFMLDDIETTLRLHPTWTRVELMKLKQKQVRTRTKPVSNISRQKRKTK